VFGCGPSMNNDGRGLNEVDHTDHTKYLILQSLELTLWEFFKAHVT
jgi:hypothetical protein